MDTFFSKMVDVVLSYTKYYFSDLNFFNFLSDVSMRRAACPSSSWKDIWWFSNPMPLRSLCLGLVHIWPVQLLNSKVPVAFPCSQSSGSSVRCRMLSTRLRRGWRVEVSHLSKNLILGVTNLSLSVLLFF